MELINTFLDEDEISLLIYLTTSSGSADALTFFLPRIKLGGASVDTRRARPGRPSPSPFTALESPAPAMPPRIRITDTAVTAMMNGKFGNLGVATDKPSRMPIILPGEIDPLLDEHGNEAYIDFLPWDSEPGRKFDQEQQREQVRKGFRQRSRAEQRAELENLDQIKDAGRAARRAGDRLASGRSRRQGDRHAVLQGQCAGIVHRRPHWAGCAGRPGSMWATREILCSARRRALSPSPSTNSSSTDRSGGGTEREHLSSAQRQIANIPGWRGPKTTALDDAPPFPDRTAISLAVVLRALLGLAGQRHDDAARDLGRARRLVRPDGHRAAPWEARAMVRLGNVRANALTPKPARKRDDEWRCASASSRWKKASRRASALTCRRKLRKKAAAEFAQRRHRRGRAPRTGSILGRDAAAAPSRSMAARARGWKASTRTAATSSPSGSWSRRCCLDRRHADRTLAGGVRRLPARPYAVRRWHRGDPGETIPPADEYVFINPVPYARRIEVGKTKSGRPFLIQVPNKIYERTAKDARAGSATRPTLSSASANRSAVTSFATISRAGIFPAER